MAELPGTDPTLPADVYASSRSRVPLIRREDLATDEQRAAYDRSANDPRSLVGLRGPSGIGLYNTKVSGLAKSLNQYLRFDTGLERTLSEVVMMTAAREMDQAFEWYAHERAARAEGVGEDVISVIRDRAVTTDLPEKEASIITLLREAIVEHDVHPETYATMVRLFGVEMLYAICVLAGQYLSTAVILHTFAQQLPPGAESSLPERRSS